MKKFLGVLSSILPFLAAEAIQIIVAYLLVFGYSFILGIQNSMQNKRAGEGAFNSAKIEMLIEKATTQEVLYLFSCIGIIVCGVVFFFWYRREIRGEVRGSAENVFTVKNVGLFVLLAVGCQFFITGVMSLIKPLFSDIFENYMEVLEGLTSGNDIVVLLLMILIAPITEELIFRGVILHKANRFLSFTGANILQAILFGIYHGNIIQGIYAALLGLLLGVVYRKYKTITASILLHMLINFSSLLVEFFPDNYVSYVLLTVIGILLVVIMLFLMKPSVQVPLKTAEEVYGSYNSYDGSVSGADSRNGIREENPWDEGKES